MSRRPQLKEEKNEIEDIGMTTERSITRPEN